MSLNPLQPDPLPSPTRPHTVREGVYIAHSIAQPLPDPGQKLNARNALTVTPAWKIAMAAGNRH